MKIGVIADDFTGASDIALTLAEAGMTVAQFNGVPQVVQTQDYDAGVVALKSRTAPVSAAVSQSLKACEWLLGQGAEQIIFKVCSTFDSTDDGNIGPVLDALHDYLDSGPVMVCPAFPENGRSVYQGHLFVNDVLLNESGMQDHPLTPMRDSDLRRVLDRQTDKKIGHIPAIKVAVGDIVLEGTDYYIVDAISDADLIQIGKAAKGRKLLCGGSGIALGLPANFGAVLALPEWEAVQGKGVVLSGSCSIATRNQVDVFRAKAPSLKITAHQIVNGTQAVDSVADWVLVQDQTPLVYSSADPAEVVQAKTDFPNHDPSKLLEDFFAELAKRLADQGVTRIVVAGGETSGAVVQALDASVLEVGPRLAAGVPAMKLRRDIDIALALKSGNFGDAQFFAEADAKLSGQVR